MLSLFFSFSVLMTRFFFLKVRFRFPCEGESVLYLRRRSSLARSTFDKGPDCRMLSVAAPSLTEINKIVSVTSTFHIMTISVRSALSLWRGDRRGIYFQRPACTCAATAVKVFGSWDPLLGLSFSKHPNCLCQLLITFAYLRRFALRLPVFQVFFSTAKSRSTPSETTRSCDL